MKKTLSILFVIVILLSLFLTAVFADASEKTADGAGNVQTELVTFHMNGHGEQIDPQEVMRGMRVSAPEKPVSEGFVFTGWYSEPECVELWDFDALVLADTDLYAGWMSQSEIDSGVSSELLPEPRIDTAAIAAVGNGADAVYYPSLQEAVDVCPTDGSMSRVTLLADTSESIEIKEGRNIVLDLNGYTLAGCECGNDIKTVKIENSSARILNGKISAENRTANSVMGIYNCGGQLTVEDVYIMSSTEAAGGSAYAVYGNNNSTGAADTEILSGSFFASGDTSAAVYSAISSIKISDGLFKAAGRSANAVAAAAAVSTQISGGRFIGNIYNSGKVLPVISGGLFLTEPDRTFIKDDCRCVANDDFETMDVYLFKVTAKTDVAQIGEGDSAVRYKSLQAAVDDCPIGASVPTTVKLLEDTEESIEIREGQNIILDLGGKTLIGVEKGKSLKAVQMRGAEAYIRNGRIVAESDTLFTVAGIVNLCGKLTAEDLDIRAVSTVCEGTAHAICTTGDDMHPASAKILSGSYYASAHTAATVYSTASELEISGGDFRAEGDKEFSVAVRESVLTKITDGRFIGKVYISGKNTLRVISGGLYSVGPDSAYIASDSKRIENKDSDTSNIYLYKVIGKNAA